MKTKKVLCILLSLILLFGLWAPLPAKAEVPFVKSINSSGDYVIVPGQATHLVVPVTLGSELYFISYGTDISIDITTPTGLFETVKGFLTDDGKGHVSENFVGIEAKKTSFIEFDLPIRETAKLGTYDAQINLVFTGYDMTTAEIITEATLPLKLHVRRELAPVQMSVSNLTYDTEEAVVGGRFDLQFDAVNGGEISAYSTFASLDFGASGMIPDYLYESVQIGNLTPGGKQKIKLPIRVLPDAEPGIKPIRFVFTYKDVDGVESTDTKTVYLEIKNPIIDAETDAKLVMSSVKFNPEVNTDESFDVVVTLENVGNLVANEVTLSFAENSVGVGSGILPMPETKKDAFSIKPGEKKEISLPLYITKSAAPGLTQIEILATYEGKKDTIYSTGQYAYLTILPTEPEKDAEEVKNEIILNNIRQTPEQPLVNQKLTVSFDITNKGNQAIEDFRIGGMNLSSNNFEPISSEIFRTVGKLEAGEKKQVSLDFLVGNDIPEGFNQLQLQYNYINSRGERLSDSTSCYILNVKNVASTNTSRPKLIVSDFSTGKEELRAGDFFDFSFSLKNTHLSKEAKNIKLTVTQAEGIFSNVSGSNSFYVEKIAPGEAYEQTISMKVRSDTATGDYDIAVEVEYEYDEMSQVDANAGGVSDKSVLRLPVIENARPAIQNIMVGYYWDTVKVNQSTNLSFDFYNMGKSTLNNVYVTLDGDFAFEMGQMHIIGSVGAGSSNQQEVSILPLNEGMCTGILTVFFEDSNGDLLSQEFPLPNTMVEADIYYYDDYNMGGFDSPMDFIDEPVAKEPLLPLWAYIAALVVALGFGLLVTRGIIISQAKKKIRNQE